jgi:hypothetical protein
MDIHEAASKLDGCQYRKEGTRELFAEMKAAGLVAVFGASDDLMEFRGAIYDEEGAGTAYLTPKGLLRNSCSDEDCPYFFSIRAKAATIEALWCAEPAVSWTYRTAIPHALFWVYEDDDRYCRGIVFALAEVPEATP